METRISGREREQRVLASLLSSTKAEFVAVYGRRPRRQDISDSRILRV
jgi:hypothetical protein